MAAAFDLTIMSPDSVLFQGRAQSLIAPGSEGYFGVLARHAPMVAALRAGVLAVVEPDGDRLYFSLASGLLEVGHDGVSVLADAGESVEDIDVARARAAEERARERLHLHGPEVDVTRAEAALQRALARLQAAEKKQAKS